MEGIYDFQDLEVFLIYKIFTFIIFVNNINIRMCKDYAIEFFTLIAYKWS